MLTRHCSVTLLNTFRSLCAGNAKSNITSCPELSRPPVNYISLALMLVQISSSHSAVCSSFGGWHSWKENTWCIVTRPHNPHSQISPEIDLQCCRVVS